MHFRVTIRCAVVGHPIRHSLSPAIHQAAYAKLGLPWTFDAVDLPDGGLPNFVAGLDASWRGLAVTMPHKADAAKVGSPDRLVQRLGVANTVVFDADDVHVYNTDVSGFVHALAYRRLDDVDDVVMLGAGATARAAVMALANIGVTKVTAQVRDPARAGVWQQLADDLGLDAAVRPLGDATGGELLLSTLPSQAANPWAEHLVAKCQAVFDVSYDPWPTKLISAAQSAALPIVTGLDLLAGQAIQQIDLLAGDTLDMAALLRAGEQGRAAAADGDGGAAMA